MNTLMLKAKVKQIDNIDYHLSLECEHIDFEDGYVQYYVTLKKSTGRRGYELEELYHFEPNDLELALGYFKSLEEYLEGLERIEAVLDCSIRILRNEI